MAESTAPDRKPIVLKDPALAAFLAWLVPGLGHLYQGRKAKAILFFVCLVGTFAYGCYLGGNPEWGYGRVVYVSWQSDDTRLPFLCQLGVGLPATPALIQAIRVRDGKEPTFGWFMAPPKPDNGGNEHFGNGPNPTNPAMRALANQPTLDQLNYQLHSYFELGTVYTMIAGLLNILAMYDAWGGPVFPEESRKEEDEAKGKGEAKGKKEGDGE